MDLEKAGKFFSDARSIWLGVAMMVGGAAWGGDLRWMQKEDGSKIAIQITVDRLSDDIEELVLEKRFETDPQKIKKIDAYIEYKEKKRAAELQKYQLR